MNKPKFIFVGGINGSGKSKILKLIANRNKKITLIQGSSVFMKWLGIKKKNYEKLQSLPDKKTLHELEKMMKYIINDKKFGKFKKVVLIDAHFVNIRNGKVQEWVGDWLALMDGLILIKASPVEILRRIKIDEQKSTRKRNIFPNNIDHRQKIQLLKIFNKKNEHVFKKYARVYNKPSNIIINRNDYIHLAVKKLDYFLTEIINQ